MIDGRAHRVMLGLSILLVAAQIVDTAWPRDDPRTASPASVVFAVCLGFVLALYPNGRFVPRWTAVVATLQGALFVAAAIAGPDVSALFLWPLPIVPLLLVLVIGGQGYRYVRRSSAAEREAARWPLLGLLVLLSIVVPVDLIAVALTGRPVAATAGLGAVMQIALLLPGLAFIAGLVVPRVDLVDRLLAGWVAIVVAAVALGAVFGLVMLLVGLVAPPPWPAWVGAGAVAAASVLVVPLARRVASALVFRGRSDPHRAVALLGRRLRATLDVADVPAEVAASIVEATGARSATLRRWEQQTAWAVAGESDPDAADWDDVIEHLGLPVATVTVQPRAGESALASADLRVIDALAAAAAPALHGARLASAFPELTERERQVLAGIVRGLPNSAIAARLGVSAKTVANYVSIVLTKLRVPDKERAAELA
ncbi:MAG: helix-turn-helix transcriptional regulator, partial [Microbacterium sp.]